MLKTLRIPFGGTASIHKVGEHRISPGKDMDVIEIVYN